MVTSQCHKITDQNFAKRLIEFKKSESTYLILVECIQINIKNNNGKYSNV